MQARGLTVISLTFWGMALNARAIGVADSDTLASDTAQVRLKEVLVTGSTVRHHGQQDTYQVTKAMREGVSDAGELLGKLNGVTFNPLSGELKYLSSKNIIILVDSVPKDEEYIKRLRPYRFDHITIVNNPSGEYAAYDALINLHTRPEYEGYEGNVWSTIGVKPGGRNGKGKDISKSISEADFTYTHNKLTLAAIANYQWTHDGFSNYYTKDYKLNGVTETTLERPLRSPANQNSTHFGTIDLSGDYDIDEHNSVSLLWRISPRTSNGSEGQTLLRSVNGQRPDTVRYSSDTRYKNFLTNNIGIYYRGSFGLWKINATATYNITTSDMFSSLSRSSGYSMTDNRHNKSEYFWGGANISRSTSNQKWHFGLSGYTSAINISMHRMGSGELLSSNKVLNAIVISSAQYYASPKLAMGVNVGFSIDKNSTMGKSDTHVSPRIAAWAAYYPSDKIVARLNYITWSVSPLLGQLQSYGQFQDSLVYRGGNPWLKPLVNHNVSLTLSLFKCLTLKGEYTTQHNYIFELADAAYGPRPDNVTGPYVTYSYANGKRDMWSANINFEKEFGKHWAVSAEASLRHLRAAYGSQSVRHTYPEYSCFVQYKNPRHDFIIQLTSALSGNVLLNPQEYGWGYEDELNIGFLKNFVSKRLQISGYYVIPVHITKGVKWSKLESQALDITRWMDYNKRANNYFHINITYRFQGGKSVKKYDHQINDIR